MLRPEFDEWLAEHYEELIAWTGRHACKNDPERAQDMLHDAVVRCLESEGLGEVRVEEAWPWVVMRIRSRASSTQRSDDRRAAMKREAATLARRAGVINKGGINR